MVTKGWKARTDNKWAVYCYGFEQQQRSERASRSRNRTAVCE